MNLQDGSFDPVEAIRHLGLELELLRAQVASLNPSATMDSASQGANLTGPYLGPAINQRIHEALWKAGYTSMEKLRAATDEELLEIKGIGKGTLGIIKGAL